MRLRIELIDKDAVKRFTEAVKTVKSDVRLTGKDENGNDWTLSAKSLLCSLIIEHKLQDRDCTAHDLDWNTLWVECDEDIYSKIQEFAVSGDKELYSK